MKNSLKRVFLCITLTASVLAVKAQDAHFSQFFAAPTYLSPSLAGSTGGLRFAANYRNQWPGIPNAYNNFSVSGDIYVNTLKSGFGALIWRDNAGTADLSTTHVGFQYTYRLQISDSWTWIPGLEFAFVQKSIDGSKANLGSDITNGGGNGAYLETSKQSYADFKFSSFFYNRKYWAGINVFHLTQPSYSFTDQGTKVPMNIMLFGGVNIWRQKAQRASQPRSFCVSYRLMHQDNFNQLDLGGYWFNRNFEVGAWWRGVPVFNNSVQGHLIDSDAIVLSAAFMMGHMRIGYSYDVPISSFSLTSAGAHEISIVYELGDIFGCGSRYLDCFTKRSGLRFNKKKPRDLRLR
ncbi:PorP/SprF family type IX secretion system membrane protein [Halosquirtibacter laminarini]|uniref:PorP/SprF family type IX secretion system membrane protein n=1 Tax=Halosquirtibacter laminarini TaxID=3374600 RepID=A0AC61NNW3_9BACT|nr:PorP/SprF family type IX secretion system membrane protein [Prolixibacteraceae bacterium]